MLQGEHSAILSTFNKLSFVIKTFVLSIFERPLNTGFTVLKSKFNLFLLYSRVTLVHQFNKGTGILHTEIQCHIK